MAVNAIAGIQNAITSTQATGASNPANSSFTDVLNEAINMTNETNAADQAGNMALLSGEEAGIHTTMIEAQKAELALQLTIQIRNKVIDAYNEIMRMQV